MISPEAVKQLTESTETQCLTAYLNTGPSSSRTALTARFKNLVRVLSASVPPADQSAFSKIVEKVAASLEQSKTSGNSVLLFTSARNHQTYDSRVPVRDEVWWGRPNVNQLLWLLDEYRPYGVVIADQQKVRFMAVRLNEFEEFKEFTNEIDTSEWRKQKLGVQNSGNGFVKGGHDLEKFNQRYMEHVRSFWRGLQRPLAELLNRFHVQRMVVAGNKSMLPEFVKTLPKELSDLIVAQVGVETFTSPADAVKKIWPEIENWERQRETTIVAQLLDSAGVSKRAAVGIDAALKFVQEGRASKLIAAKDFDSEVLQCTRCSFVTAKAQSNSTPASHSCPQCSASEVEKGVLATVLPVLVAKARIPVEIVKGQAAENLRANGGVGVFLRF